MEKSEEIHEIWEHEGLPLYQLSLSPLLHRNFSISTCTLCTYYTEWHRKEVPACEFMGICDPLCINHPFTTFSSFEKEF